MQIQRSIPQLVLSIGYSALLVCAFFIAFAYFAPARIDAATLSGAHSAFSPELPTTLSSIGFASNAYTVSEGVAAGTILLLVVQPSPSPVTVTVSSANVPTGAEASKDFVGLRQSLVISPNESTYTLTIQLLDDAVVEGEESLRLTLSNYQAVLPGAITETIVTIIDDDTFPRLAFAPAEANETESALRFVATLSSAWPHTVTVEYSTRDGTAIAPDDYLPTSGVLTFAPEQTTATVAVALIDDDVDEPAENLFVQFANPVQAIPSAAEVAGTIRDGDDQRLFLPALLR